MTPKLLLIDDDPEIASALARGLALHGYDAVTENRADRGLKRLCSEHFSGAIVDVMIGDDSGVELVREARAVGVAFPIVMLSALSDVEHRTAGLAAGADDYVVKPFSFDELVARLQVQEHRVTASRPDPAKLDRDARVLRWGEEGVALTEREYELLEILIESAGVPLSRGYLYDTLWQAEGASNENVVDVYIGYLRKKLLGSGFGFEIRTMRNKGFFIEGRFPVFSGP